MNVQHTVGPEKVSMTVMRKTEGDLIMGQASYERWYVSGKEADEAMTHLLRVLADGGYEKMEVVHVVRLEQAE